MPLGMEVGLGPGDFVLDGDPVPPPLSQKAHTHWSRPKKIGPCLLWPNGWMDQDGILGMEVGLSPGDLVVLDGDPAPLPKKGAEPPRHFSAHVYCGQTARWIKVVLGMEVGLGRGHILLDGEPAHLPKKGAEPLIFGPFYCRQTAECIKMPLGMDVGLSPGDFVCVRWGSSFPSPKWAQPPIFGECPLWPNDWMD